MARMISPFTGSVFEVADEHVNARLAKGFELLDGERVNVTQTDEPKEPEEPGEVEEAEEAKPDETCTVSEIRAYAKRHGIELPRGAKKSDMLELL